MKRTLLLLISILLVTACSKEQKKKNTANTDAMAQSVGRINELSVIIDTDEWKGALGDTIRKYFGAEVPGLPQEEPLFSMRQIPPTAFSGIARKNRTFLKINMSGAKEVSFLKNKYATPQIGVILSGADLQEISDLISSNIDQITEKFKNTETTEKQRRIRKSLEKLPQLKEKFGIALDVPSAYRIAREDEDFIWLRKDIPNGDMNLIIYEIPLSSITADTSVIADIIKVRDSVGSSKIPTNTGKFITEEAYAPYLYEEEVQGKFTYVTKGTWEIKDRFMAGPFVNYMIKNPDQNRYLILEGFILSPSSLKRDNMFELEAIIKSIQF